MWRAETPAATLEVHILRGHGNELREECRSHLLWAVAVEEGGGALRVAVKVQEQWHARLLLDLAQVLAQRVNLGVVVGAWVFPTAIRIDAFQRATRIPINHTVHIDHGHYVEAETLAERDGLRRWADQEADETRQDPTGNRLARVLPRNEDHSRLPAHALVKEPLAHVGGVPLGVRAQARGRQALCHKEQGHRDASRTST
mmetsp:Transcript_58007/g.161875  ORF Transcript_58007/g.161875 Transcript_58007/m.161875 type:complete len:200 (+) Transcript_58007:655-1254(+)